VRESEFDSPQTSGDIVRTSFEGWNMVDASPSAQPLPLKGLTVLVVESFGAGPYGSMMLADLGATVIKIENHKSGGDPSRSMGPYFLGEHDSQYFTCLNLNKKSICLDLAAPLGKAAFLRLVARADAVMNNLRGDGAEKLGLTYDALKGHNPRIVCGHISAYGRDNERKTWPGYDYLMQAEAGFMHLTGEPGNVPSRAGVSMIDFMTGTMAALGLVSAILQMRETGTGRDIDICLFDVALHQLSYTGTWQLNEDVRFERQPRSAHGSAVPVQIFPTEDGWLFVMCMTEGFWKELTRAIEREDLAADERFKAMALRRENKAALIPILDEVFVQHPTTYWLERLRPNVPVAPVFDLAQALGNSFPESTGMIREIAHRNRPDLRVFANPMKLDGRRLESRAPSALGADTKAVLREAGFTNVEIEQLESAN
jgi:crotonobetainyl-CoA:carnitine CoA-transferase CaiB-like acyl-CoA transferase